MTDPHDLIRRLADEFECWIVNAEVEDIERAHNLVNEARAYLDQPEPEATITEPRGCPTPGACSCPTAPYVPPELIRALELAEAALADISDTEREPWSEARAAQDLPRIRAVLARWGRPVFRQKELTDEQLLKCFKIATPCYNMEDWKRELDGMRAAIAADRALCARLAVEPAPVNELVDLAHELRKTAEYLQGGCGWAKALDAIERAAILIESNALRLIAPTPVSERPWERDGWCDNNGWCWGFDADDTDPCWSFDKPEGCPTWTHLLPHNALPIPTPTA